MGTSRAAVLNGPNQMTVESIQIPLSSTDDAVIRIEATGLCGSDVDQVKTGGRIGAVVPGHEPLGLIESIGADAAERWGVSVGDRVCVEVVVPCHNCRRCSDGAFSSCENSLGSYGYRPFTASTQLIGGFAEHMYVHPNSILHPIDRDLPATTAAMFNTVAAGISWAVHLGGVKTGDTVVIFGAGQRGIAAAMASKAAGASTVIITGLARDAHKLELSKEFGVDYTVVADVEDVPERIRTLTDGRLADVVLDLTPLAAQPVQDAIEVVRIGGRIVLAGLKHDKPIPIETDRIVQKGITLVGALGVTSAAIREAIALIESGTYPLEKLHTHTFGLDEVVHAIAVLAGDVAGEDAVHVAIVPV